MTKFRFHPKCMLPHQVGKAIDHARIDTAGRVHAAIVANIVLCVPLDIVDDRLQ